MTFKSNFSYSESNSSYSDLLNDIDSGNIQSIFFYPRRREVDVLYKDGSTAKIPILYNDQQILRKATENGVQLTINNSRRDTAIANSAVTFGLLLIFIFSFLIILRGTSKLASKAFGFGKSKAKFLTIDDVDTRFDDVAGVPEAAEELKELITFLKRPEKLLELGAKVPRGVLLIGPPGTGKTLLAKAIAGESGVPFIYISASEFVELFVGVGASRVRDLFEKASQKSPCIIFIDEIDSIGRQRGSGIGGGNDEREQTLNQLLTELDGFADNSGVIVLAATNRPDILDSALLRPGRFDRKIEVMLPDLDGRRKILAVHALTKPLSNKVNLNFWATRTVGFSGADLENLLNESAIHCARSRAKQIRDEHIEDALEKITLGLRSTKLSDSNSKRLRAYNEVGRALVSAVRNGVKSIDKISLLPRVGNLAALTKIAPDEEVISSGLISKRFLLTKIEIALAGRAAETVVFGFNEITQYAQNDLSYATGIAREMVTKYGFSILGPVNTSQDSSEVFLGNSLLRNKSSIADITTKQIDEEIMEISKKALFNSMNVISKNRYLLDKIVDVLMNEETIDNKRFVGLVSSSLKV